jgi:hypothetical protein
MTSRRKWIAQSIADIPALALYYMFAFGVALMTDPWLHLRAGIGSEGLDGISRFAEMLWGAIFLSICVGGFWFPRPAGLTAAFLLVIIRLYDFAHSPLGPNFVFLIGQVWFAVLAVRGTIRRTEVYALARPRKRTDDA